MQELRELISVSAYEPQSGYSLDLKRMVEAGLERQEALRRWLAMGRTEVSFYKTYKALKDSLVRLAFLDRKDTGIAGRKMEVWEKYKVVNQLLIEGRKKAAVTLAIDLVALAQKTGCTEIVVGISSLLETHFGSIELDTRRYLKYRKLRKDYSQFLEDELWVKSLVAKLAFYISKKKDIAELAHEIAALVGKPNGSLTFMKYRFSALSAWYEHLKDVDGLINAFHETVAIYEAHKEELSQGAFSNLYFWLIPVLVTAGRFAQAETHLSKVLQSIPVGTHNWHLFMLQRACLGILSKKPGMAKSAMKKAQEAPREHNNPAIDKGWATVEAILKGKEVADVWKEVLG